MRRFSPSVSLLLLALTVGFAACTGGGDDDDDGTTPSPSPSPSPTAVTCTDANLGDYVSNGVLVVSGTSSVPVGSEPLSFDRLCVKNQSALILCDGAATLSAMTVGTSVIGGRGIGGITSAMTMTVNVVSGSKLFVLVDNDEAPATLTLGAGGSDVHIALTGSQGLLVQGTAQSTTYYAGWGDTSAFPDCP